MADAQASGACYGNIVWVQVPSPASSFWKCMRKCRNWQTSKTKDLVLATACGFKSHLPHGKGNRKIPFFLSYILFIQYPAMDDSIYDRKFINWNGSSAGMSVRLTRERSWVRTPSVPLPMPQDLFCVLRHIAVCSFTVFHKKFIIFILSKKGFCLFPQNNTSATFFSWR